MSIALVLLLVEPFPFPSLAAGLHKKHDFGCSRCHSTHRARGKWLWTQTPSPETARGTPLLGSDSMCYSCHRGEKAAHMFEGGFTHPSGIPVKSMQVPSYLPLVKVTGVGDVMTCITCHNPHTKADRMLRMPLRDDELCLACHQFK